MEPEDVDNPFLVFKLPPRRSASFYPAMRHLDHMTTGTERSSRPMRDPIPTLGKEGGGVRAVPHSLLAKAPQTRAGLEDSGVSGKYALSRLLKSGPWFGILR
jgi:hypothetical protein